MLGFGLLAGMIGGATNAMAPFLMMYLLSCQLSKTDIVIISNLNFIASKLVQLTLLFPILISLQTHQRHILLGITLFALIGVWLGGKIRHRLSQQHFKYLVLFFLFGLGIYALWQSVGLLQHSTILFK
jgi:Sulfite exporter TauE/SafE.